jgi:hypothetical protein
MTRRTRPLLLLLSLLAPGGAACYEYLPARDAGALAGQRVQLSLTDSGAVVLASKIGPSIEAIEGSLLADSAGAYVVAVGLTRGRGGVESDWRGERLAVPHVLVASFARRQFSTSRSVFAGALMTAGLVAATVGLRGGGGATGGGVPVPGQTPGQ